MVVFLVLNMYHHIRLYIDLHTKRVCVCNLFGILIAYTVKPRLYDVSIVYMFTTREVSYKLSIHVHNEII